MHLSDLDQRTSSVTHRLEAMSGTWFTIRIFTVLALLQAFVHVTAFERSSEH
ncbi:hypothetical protein X737_32840 [Mesorhizobium sp. L48C026A00]|nr:hypothetical protein X737_32840 [Mesorhizobium sp. L48C026A00]